MLDSGLLRLSGGGSGWVGGGGSKTAASPVLLGVRGQQGHARPLVDLVLEDVEVVGGGNGDDVLLRVPRGVKDLLAEVQAVNADLILPPLPTHTHLAGLQNRSGFAIFSGCFQRDVTFGVPVKHSEKIVVGTGHYYTV